MVVYKPLVINSQNTLTHTFGQTKSTPAVMSAEILKSDKKTQQKNKTESLTLWDNSGVKMLISEIILQMVFNSFSFPFIASADYCLPCC